MYWSEVWTFLIPLTVFLFYKLGDKRMRIVLWYVISSFIILFLANYIAWNNDKVPEALRNNNILYNLNTFLKGALVGGYLVYHPSMKKFRFIRYFFGIYILFVVINFTFWGSIFSVNTVHFSATTIFLLIICLTFFINSIMDDEEYSTFKDPAIMISIGISIFESINFFTYLFLYMFLNDKSFLLFMMKIFMCSFIVYNIFIALAFYYGRKKKKVLLEKGLAI